MYTQEAHEGQPEVEQEIVEGHIWLGFGNNLKEHWQRLLGARHRENLVEPETGRVDFVEIKAHRRKKERQHMRGGRPATRLIKARKKRLRHGRSRYIFNSTRFYRA